MYDGTSWLSKIKDILSLTTKQLFIVAFISWTIVLIPPQFFALYGLSLLRELSLPYLTGMALISSLWLLSLYAYSYIGKMNYRRAVIQYLKDLTPVEQTYLLNYAEDNTSTFRFRIDDGVARGLTNKNILYLASEVSYRDTEFDFNIQPWVLKYLKAKPKLLEQGSSEEAKKQFENQIRPPWVW